MDPVALDDSLVAAGGEGGVASHGERGDGARELLVGKGGRSGVEKEKREALATFFSFGG